jgi:hypothetical protein
VVAGRGPGSWASTAAGIKGAAMKAIQAKRKSLTEIVGDDTADLVRKI